MKAEGMPLKNKSVLFLCPSFFHYEKSIANKMEQLGAEVCYYDERSVKSAFARALLKVCPMIFKSRTRKYYDLIIKGNQNRRFDYIFIVKCDMVDATILQRLREVFPDAKLCLYLWDSVKNISGVLDKIQLFDRSMSFDRLDCEYNEILKFRPLFFDEHYSKTQEGDKQYTYDMAFCGTVHSDRLGILQSIEKSCEQHGFRFYKFYYLQSKFIYWFYKAVKKEFRGVKKDVFSFEKRAASEIAQVEADTKVIIDIQHPNQTGLTMRTVEMIGMGKKLITTNTDVVNYDFYDEQNVCVIDRNNPRIDVSFMNSEYRPLKKDVYEKYSLRSWVLDVLGIEEEK